MQESSGEHPTFDVDGPRDAPAIVFVHGAAWTRRMWAPQMAALAQDFRVIALDLPGHGARKGEPFRLASATQALNHVTHEAAEGRVLLVGLSLGGYVAIAYAARYPDQCAGLVLSGCCVKYRGLIGILSQLDATLVLRLLGERRVSDMQARSVLKSFPGDIAETQLAAGFTFEVMPAVYHELQGTDFRAQLATYAGPVLLLNGENDRVNRRAEQSMLRAASSSKLTIIPGAGHLCNLDQPETFTTTIREFAVSIEQAELG